MPKLTPQWQQGPVTDRIIDAHPRPINAICVRGDELVTASQDHGLKVFKLSSGEQKRELFTKNYGHQEWVTTVDYVQDGRILSGGMDSKLCLWNATGVKCIDLLGHRGSISKVQCGPDNIALSASYDKTVKVWDLDSSQCISTLSDPRGHHKGIQNLLWRNSLVCSGGRDGIGCLWDINTGKLIVVLEEHQAPMSCIRALTDDDETDDRRGARTPTDGTNVLITGGLDGAVCVWDLRTSGLVHKIDAVRGSVNDIKITNPADTPKEPSPQIIVAGSDKSIRVLDPRSGFKVSREMKEHKDIVCTLAVCDNLVLSGGGNGWVLVHDFITGKCVYGVSATEQGCCTCLEVVAPKHFVASGDDGKVIIFDY